MPNVYERDRRVIKGEALVLVEGKVEWRTGAVAVRARRVLPLDDALASSSAIKPGPDGYWRSRGWAGSGHVKVSPQCGHRQ